MNDASSPLVSVVTATRNRPVWLETALQSVAKQTLREFESILIDDGSDEQTLQKYDAIWKGLDERFTINKPAVPGSRGSGPAGARNRGAKLARGAYIAFLDDDDRWRLDDHLAVAVDTMQRTDADLYFTNMQGENDGRVTIPDWFPDSPWLTRGPKVNDQPAVHEVALGNLMRAMRHHYPHPNGCIFSRRILDEVGLFWEGVTVGEDVALVLRVADRARKILYRPDPVVGYNVTPRESAFSRASPVDRSLYVIAAMQHTRSLSTHGVVRRCARCTEGWHFRQIAQYLLSQGAPATASSMAWQSLCVFPTLGSGSLWLKSATKALLGPRQQPIKHEA